MIHSPLHFGLNPLGADGVRGKYDQKPVARSKTLSDCPFPYRSARNVISGIPGSDRVLTQQREGLSLHESAVCRGVAYEYCRQDLVSPYAALTPEQLPFRALCLSGGRVGRDRRPDQRLEGAFVDLLALVDVDRPPHVPFEARVEEPGRILQGSPLGESELHDGLVRLAGADDALVRPDRGAHPLPLLDDLRVRFLDELAHPAEGFAAPIPELGDSFRDELRCRFALVGARLFHVFLLSEQLFPVRCRKNITA